jgi:hypothetical protein
LNQKVNDLNGLLETVLPKSTVSRITKMAAWFHQTSDGAAKIAKLDAFERKLFWNELIEKKPEQALCSAKGLKQVAVAAITGNYAFVTDSGLQCVLRPLSLDKHFKKDIAENIRSQEDPDVAPSFLDAAKRGLFNYGLVASFRAQETVFGLTVTAIHNMPLPGIVTEPLNVDTIAYLRNMLAIIKALKRGELPVSHGLVEFCFINSSVYSFREPQFEVVATAIHNGETPEVTVLLQKNKRR